MTKQEDYPAQVAALIEQAFHNLGNGLVEEHGKARSNFFAEANLQVEAAKAIATLNAARETRLQTLVDLATAVPADGSPVNSDLVQEAYTAAAYGLGLIQEEPDQERIEEIRRALQLDDPADADLGDLK